MTFRFSDDHDALAGMIDPELLDAMADIQQLADEAGEAVQELRLPDMFAERRQAIIDRLCREYAWGRVYRLRYLRPEKCARPVELIGKLCRDGNPAEFLTMQDIDNLVAFIEGQRDVINAQQRRIAQLIEDDGVRRNGARLERENLQQYVASVEAERDHLSAMLNPTPLP